MNEETLSLVCKCMLVSSSSGGKALAPASVCYIENGNFS
jgi:hypothetical protein